MRRENLFISIFLLTLFGCRKDPSPDNPYGLPNATTEGRGIMAARVNDTIWVANSKALPLVGRVTDTSFYIIGTQEIGNATHAYTIQIKFTPSVNVPYSFNNENHKFIYSALNSSCFDRGGGYGVVNVENAAGEVTFTKVDRSNRIVSGKFWCNIPTTYCDILKVREGRFDLR